jgi:hypothetical protein
MKAAGLVQTLDRTRVGHFGVEDQEAVWGRVRWYSEKLHPGWPQPGGHHIFPRRTPPANGFILTSVKGICDAAGEER